MACSSKLGIPPGSHFLCGGAVMVERETANANTQAPSTSANPGATQTSQSLPELKKGDVVYRVYGGDSGIDGQSWTTVKPSDFEGHNDLLIEGLGLPNKNTAKYVIRAEVIDPSRCKIIRSALPLDGHQGGLPEYMFDNPLGTWKPGPGTTFPATPALKPLGITISY